MAKEQLIVDTSENATSVTLTQAQLIELMREIKKPYVDEQIEARKERAKSRLREEREQSELNRVARENGCSHMRGDNTSRIAWNDYFIAAKNHWQREGYCQACNKHFKPGVDQFEQYVRIPTGRDGVIY